jgi:hypothetical protein
VRRVLSGVAPAPAGALAAEEVPEGGAEGRRTLRPPEAPDRRARLIVSRPVRVRVFAVAAVFLLFLLVVIILVYAEAKPGRDAFQTISNSHPASSRTGLCALLDQCPPDPHYGGPFFNGDRIVVAHAHRELREVEVGTPTTS